MKRFMRCFILLLLFFVVAGGADAKAATPVDWVNSPIVKVKEVPASALPQDATTCSGTMMPIETKSSDGTTMACVFGGAEGMRLARLTGSTNGPIYAFAYPFEVKYSVIRDFCLHKWYCAYGQSEDTAIVQDMLPSNVGYGHRIEQHFSSHLTKFVPDSRYLQYIPEGMPQYVQADGQDFTTASIALSAGGRWAVVELKAYGFVRIDLRTLKMQRIVAPGALYGLGNDPTFEIAITDDGSKVAVTGFRAGIDVYEVTENCGDDFSKGRIERYFAPYVSICKQSTIDRYNLIPGFTNAHIPHFSAEGARLTVFVPLAQRNIFVTLAPRVENTPSNGFGYIAFGDSFTSGEGETSDAFYQPATNISSNKCHVSTRSYPFLIGKWWELTTNSFACSGSQIPDVIKANEGVLGRGIVGNGVPHVVSLGVGGNDVDLVGKLKSCLGIGTCEWARPERRVASAEEIRALFPKLVELITKLKNDYSQVPLVLVGYPRVINIASTACNAFVSLALTPDERQYFDESIKYLNRILYAAAQSTGVTYVDIEDSLVGEQLCDTNETAMNSVRLGDDIAPLSFFSNMKVIGAESFHPTPRGHQRIAQKIQEQLKDFWQSPFCTTCSFNEDMLKPSPYWEHTTPTSPSFQQVTRAFIYARELEKHTLQPFMFPAGTFKPSVPVRLELHSDPLQLGEYRARQDGSLEGSIKIPDVENGYHTLHALGANAGDAVIDFYETVYIHDKEPTSLSSSSVTGLPEVATQQTVLATKAVSLPKNVAQLPEVLGSSTYKTDNALGSTVPAAKGNLPITSDKNTSLPNNSLSIVGGTIIACICFAALGWIIWLQRRGDE